MVIVIGDVIRVREVELGELHVAETSASPAPSLVGDGIDLVGQLVLLLLLAEITPDLDLHTGDRPTLFVGHGTAECLLAGQKLDGNLPGNLRIPGVDLREEMALLDVALSPDVEIDG